MSDWKAGDLALCIKGGHIEGVVLSDYPKAGKVYLVSRVGVAVFDEGVKSALWFSDGPLNSSGISVWGQFRFIKVTPPCDMKIVEEPAKVTADDAMRAAMGMEPAKWHD